MRILGFIMALIAGVTVAEESAVSAAAVAAPALTATEYDANPGQAVPSPAAKLDVQLDKVSRELEAALEQRMAERAAAIIPSDRLLVSAD